MRVFVTGVSSGIGRELAIKLLEAGHEVWAIARRTPVLDELPDELLCRSFRFDECDISDSAAMEKAHAKMVSQGFLPDVVILNAAVDLDDEFPGLDYSQGCQMMRTNVDGAYFWITKFIDAFVARGSGQFIAVSSLFAHWPDSASVSYASSKAALTMIMRGLRLRYSTSNLQFKVLYLGPVDTPINPRFTPSEKPPSPIVASANKTAGYIVNMMSRNHNNFYFPLYIFAVFTFLRGLPDSWFELLTKRFKR